MGPDNQRRETHRPNGTEKETLTFGHAATTKMLAEAPEYFYARTFHKKLKTAKSCEACMASGKNSKYQIPKK